MFREFRSFGLGSFGGFVLGSLGFIGLRILGLGGSREGLQGIRRLEDFLIPYSRKSPGLGLSCLWS